MDVENCGSRSASTRRFAGMDFKTDTMFSIFLIGLAVCSGPPMGLQWASSGPPVGLQDTKGLHAARLTSMFLPAAYYHRPMVETQRVVVVHKIY